MKLLTLFFILAMTLNASAWGCLNDQELPQREREFRSQYRSNEMVRAEAPTEFKPPQTFSLLPVGGVAMLIGSLGLIWLSVRD